MKYLLLALSMVSLSAYSQIGEPSKADKMTTVGKVSPGGVLIAKLEYSVNPDSGDTLYILSYHNYKYKNITDIKMLSFYSKNGDAEKLYELFKSVFSEENRKNKDYMISVPIGKDNIAIANFKSMGSTLVAFMNDNKDYGLLTEKQVDKLFGKD